MELLTISDLWPLPVYEALRDEYRKSVIAAKKDRRIGVGPFMTIVFENRTTVKFQVQEILRVEKISDPKHVQEELDGFNSMLPGNGELSATLMIELVAPEPEVAETLRGLQGLGKHFALHLGNLRIAGLCEPGRDDGKRVAAIQYLRFPVGDARGLLLDPACQARFVIDHPRYRHELALPEGVRRSLAADLGTSRETRT